jgi:hypothetical protein
MAVTGNSRLALTAIENPACLLPFEKALRHFPGQKLNDTALVLRWS